MRPADLEKLLAIAINKRENILIKGAPGIGKTDIVYQAATRADADVIISHPVVDDPVDYKGLPYMHNERADFLPFGNLLEAIEAKKPTIYFLDDLGQAPPVVQAAAMQLILARKINGHKVSPFVTFIGATNRKQDRAGVSGVLEPVKSRFASIIELHPTNEDWVKWALSNDIHEDVIAFIRLRPELLFDDGLETEKGQSKLAKRQNDMVNGPCPRTVAAVSRWLGHSLPENIVYETISGAVGEGWAAEFEGFRKIIKKMPDPDRVLMSPDTVDIPNEPAIKYALCGAIGRKAREGNMARVVTFANRLPADFSVLLMMDAIHHGGDEVTRTKAFLEWANEHSDVLMV
jgi:hypothetical protein